jgi:hypothetical protein
MALTENVRAYHQILLRLEPALDQTAVLEASTPAPSENAPLATDGFLL